MFFCAHERPDWQRDGTDWPNREASRFVRAGGLRWHVQVLGEGPVLLLVHGTGAATHSWRDLAPRLAQRFTVVAVDLPGHGFSELPASRQLSLKGMSQALSALLATLELDPAIGVGHSAGAALLLRMTADGLLRPKAILSINGALLPFGGPVGKVASPLAKMLFLNPLAPRLISWRGAKRGLVEQILERTGSKLDEAGVEHYRTVVQRPSHAFAALGMMANWDLPALQADFAKITVPVVLIAGDLDGTVPARDAPRVAKLLPNARVLTLPDLGHLAHEEAPGLVASLIEDEAKACVVLTD